MKIKATIKDQQDLRIRAGTFKKSNLEDFDNIDKTVLENGSVLVYSTSINKWISTTTLDAQNMEGGEF